MVSWGSSRSSGRWVFISSSGICTNTRLPLRRRSRVQVQRAEVLHPEPGEDLQRDGQRPLHALGAAEGVGLLQRPGELLLGEAQKALHDLRVVELPETHAVALAHAAAALGLELVGDGLQAASARASSKPRCMRAPPRSAGPPSCGRSRWSGPSPWGAGTPRRPVLRWSGWTKHREAGDVLQLHLPARTSAEATRRNMKR